MPFHTAPTRPVDWRSRREHGQGQVMRPRKYQQNLSQSDTKRDLSAWRGRP
jgi:hypothetical protein